MKKQGKIKLFIILCLSLTIILATTVNAISSMDEFDQRQQEIDSREDKLDAQLESAKQNIEEQEELVKAYEDMIDVTEDQIDLLNETIYGLQKEIEEKEKQIAQMEIDIEEDYVLLGQRIRAIYMEGKTSNLEMLLGTTNLEDLIDSAYLTKSIADYDNELIQKINDEIVIIEQEKEILAQEKADLEVAQQELKETSDELIALVLACEEEIAKLEKEQQEVEEELHTLSKEQEDLMAELEAWEKEQAALRAEQEAAQNANNGNNSSSGGGYLGVPNPDGNGYIWPTPECDIITSYWGDGRNHRGWDFACYGSAYGKEIVAVKDGVVTVANNTDSWGSGWGYYIMIDHGDGYSTLYAHCSYVAVSVGQTVKQGETIGYVGNTGNSFGDHLHFECWKDGVRYDPAIEFLS